MHPDPHRPALSRRLLRRTVVQGELVVPAVPSMAEDHVAMCAEVFAAVGRAFSDDEREQLRASIRSQSELAFAASSRANLVITYEATAGSAVSYLVAVVPSTLGDTYDQWTATREGPLFGTHPDARVASLAAAGASALRVLDVGAGTGRNALALARHGHRVDAVELTPAFAEALRGGARAEGLAVRVVERDVFDAGDVLRRDYDLVVASELATDLRTTAELRALFHLAAERLAPGGRFVLNAFVARAGYRPDEVARELGQQLYTSVFTREELDEAARDSSLHLVADDLALAYEEAHLPAEAWPPTAWYVDWARGLDLFDLAPDECPIELRWLVYGRPLS